MCLIVLGKNIHPKYRLILAANRDEVYERPTKPVHYWDKPNQLLAGKDLEAGGTWLGINRYGDLAAVTNFRDPINYQPGKSSRGQIPVDFLEGRANPDQYLHHLQEKASNFNGYNLLGQKEERLFHYNNQLQTVTELNDGIHAVSNATINTPWPKVVKAKEMFKTLTEGAFDHDALVEMMSNRETADPEKLPDTGIPLEMEVAVSAMCIRTEKYGTCSCTVITITHDEEVEFSEKSYPVGNRTEATVRYSYRIQK